MPCDAELVAAIQRLQARYMTPELRLELDALQARKRSLRYDVDEAYSERRAYKDKASKVKFERALARYDEDQAAFADRINALSVCAAKPTPWKPDPAARAAGFFKAIAEAAESAFMKVVCGRNVHVIRALKADVSAALRELEDVRGELAGAAFSGWHAPNVKPMVFEPMPAPEIPDALTPAQSLDTDYIAEREMAALLEHERLLAERRAESDRLQAKLRAESERQRAESERRRAESERLEAERRADNARSQEEARQRYQEELDAERLAAETRAADRAAFTASEGPKVVAKVDAWVAFVEPGSTVPMSKAVATISGDVRASELLAKVEALERQDAEASTVFKFLERAARDTANAAYAAVAMTYNRVLAWPLMRPGVEVVGPRGSASWILHRACGAAGYSRAQSESALVELQDFLNAVNLTTVAIADQLVMMEGAYPHAVRMYTSARDLEGRIADCRDTHELSLVFHDASEKALLRDNESIAHMVAWVLGYVRGNTQPSKKQLRLLAGIAERYMANVKGEDDTETLRAEVSLVREDALRWRATDVVKACDGVLAKLHDGFFDAAGGGRLQAGGGFAKAAFKMLKDYFRYHLRHGCGFDPYYDTIDRLEQHLGTLTETIADKELLWDERVDAEARRRVAAVYHDKVDMAQKRVWHDTLMIRLKAKDPKSRDIARVLDAFESTDVEELRRMISDVFAYDQPTVDMWRTEPEPEPVPVPLHPEFVAMGEEASKEIAAKMAETDDLHARLMRRFEERSGTVQREPEPDTPAPSGSAYWGDPDIWGGPNAGPPPDWSAAQNSERSETP